MKDTTDTEDMKEVKELEEFNGLYVPEVNENKMFNADIQYITDPIKAEMYIKCHQVRNCSDMLCMDCIYNDDILETVDAYKLYKRVQKLKKIKQRDDV